MEIQVVCKSDWNVDQLIEIGVEPADYKLAAAFASLKFKRLNRIIKSSALHQKIVNAQFLCYKVKKQIKFTEFLEIPA